MQTIEDLEVSCVDASLPQPETDRNLFARLERKKLLVIISLVALALSIRLYRLDAAGLAEDETNKVFALRSYSEGDFAANAEHPMLMKLLCWASVSGAKMWNDSAGETLGLHISEESALRFPNALSGSLTVIPILLLGSAIIGFRAALIASLLWATGLHAVWFNRVAKEDTLLVFFMMMGFYLYNRAKETTADTTRQERLYALAGASFGLMLCSKYFPHYFLLNHLFHHLAGYNSRNNRPLTRRILMRYFAAMTMAFLLFNWALFMPETWRYLGAYLNREFVTHHGYLMMDALYSNDFFSTPDGAPWYFYYLFLTVKTPLPLLAAFLIGAIEIFRHRGEPSTSRGYLFLRMMLVFWLFPMALIGAKFLRYTLPLMPIVYMTAAAGILIIWRIVSSLLEKILIHRPIAYALAACSSVCLFIIAPTATTIRSMPHPSLYVNALGGGRTGYFFPHDEFYDLGARESIHFIAEHAPAGATVASEIPGVMRYYLEHYRREDIKAEIISRPGGAPRLVLLQSGRVYFENREDVDAIRRDFRAVQSSSYNGTAASEVFDLGETAQAIDRPPVSDSKNR
ncbi:MAG: phospholipid carrier-dependent glycosyltransferase [Acidobacteriota bacterium]